MTSAPRQAARDTGRAPLSSLGIPFGLSGLAGTWTMAAATSLAVPLIAEGLWILAAAAWIAVVANYLRRSRNRGGSIREDLRDPVQGAFASLAPTSAMLICTHYAQQVPMAGRIATGVFMAIGLLYGAWFLAQLALRERSIDAVHAGYLLPTVAAAFIIGQSAGAFGWTLLGEAAIAVGILFWLVLGTIILARMAFRPAPPAALLPTFAIFSAPPAVAGRRRQRLVRGERRTYRPGADDAAGHVRRVDPRATDDAGRVLAAALHPGVLGVHVHRRIQRNLHGALARAVGRPRTRDVGVARHRAGHPVDREYRRAIRRLARRPHQNRRAQCRAGSDAALSRNRYSRPY